MSYTDTHAHIYASKFDKDRDDIIRSAVDLGVGKIYMPNIDVDSIDAMLEAEMRYPQNCIPMMGLHPCHVNKEFEKQLYVMEEWINKRDFSAIGETGLDLYWDKTHIELQKESLKIHIQWAKQKKLPIVLHCREAMDEVIEIIKSEKTEDLLGIFHCFSGTLEQAKEIIALGFHMGIGGVVTYKNGGLDQILPEIGLEHLVLETDSPYLAPVPHRGKRNSPEYIPIIAEKISGLLGISLQEVSEVTQKNARKVYHRYQR